MTHEQLLLAHLRDHGRASYRDLVAQYGVRGYSYHGFAAAACRLRAQGLIVGPHGHGKPLALAECCPCCGRRYDG